MRIYPVQLLPSEPEPIEHSDAGAQIDCRRRKTQADSPAFLPGYWVSELPIIVRMVGQVVWENVTANNDHARAPATCDQRVNPRDAP